MMMGLSIFVFVAGLSLAQQGELVDGKRPVFTADVNEPMPATFGVTTVSNSGFQGKIYFLPEFTLSLPNFKKLKSVGTLYTDYLNIPPRDFMEGFPGITNRFEWFAIDYTGRFWIEKPGKYQFALVSDDGSILYIDQKRIIDNDGHHPAQVQYGSAKLAEGAHDIRISYFQGPRTALALIFAVQRPGDKDYKIFDMRRFRPPSTMENLPAPDSELPK